MGALAYDTVGAELWSVGDRSSLAPGEFFGRIYRIAPAQGGDTWVPLVEIPFEREVVSKSLFRFLTDGGADRFDFEGLAPLGGPAGRPEFVAVSESTGPAILRLGVARDGRARVLDWRRLAVPVASYKGDRDRGLEGIAVDTRGGVLYAALEESKDGAGHLIAYPWPIERDPPDVFVEGREPVAPLWTRRIHDPRWGRPGRLNDLVFTRRGGVPTLWAVQADAKRLLRLDFQGEPEGCWTLDLRAPDGEAYEGAWPEGLAVDPDRGRIWIVTDPHDLAYRPAGWFRRASGLYAKGVPMLYEIPMPGEPDR